LSDQASPNQLATKAAYVIVGASEMGMRLQVKVSPRAKKCGIESATDGTLVVKVNEPAEDGRANAAVIEALAAHFKVAKRAVTIVHGQTSRRKLVEILK
jgi:hypothetical protein